MAYQPDESRSYRSLFAVLGVALIGVTLWSVVDELRVRRPWKEVQERMAERLPAARREVRIRQLVVPRLGVVDRCTSCHLGSGRAVPAGGPHPGGRWLLGAHPPERFGCTPCHGGQGLALTAGTAHGEGDPDWPDPMLRGDFAQSRCLGCHRDDLPPVGAPLLRRGRRLFRELGCFGCHGGGVAGAEARRRGPSLRRVASKLRPEALMAWLARPTARRRRFRMPLFWPGADHSAALGALREMEVRAIASYLFARSEPFVRGGSPALPREGGAERGRGLFDRVGCRGCHVLGGEGQDDVLVGAAGEGSGLGEDSDDGAEAFDEEPDPQESGGGDPAGTREAPAAGPPPIDHGPPLGQEGARTSYAFLVAWIRRPASYDPGARMPDLGLSLAQASDLAAFLASLGAPSAAAVEPPIRPPLDPALVADGEKLVAAYGCAGCHDLTDFSEPPKVGPDLSEFGAKDPRLLFFGDARPARDLRTWERYTATKIRDPRAFRSAEVTPLMPVYDLGDEDVRALAVFLKGLRSTRIPSDYVAPGRAPEYRLAERVLGERNCAGCHGFEGRPGDILRYYRRDDLGPPPLAGEGARTQPSWLFRYLVRPRPLRPWLEIRMPRFGLSTRQAGALVRDLARRARRPAAYRSLDVRPITSERAALGARFFARLKCVTCHLLDNRAGVEAAKLAPDLGLARERLDPKWIRAFLVDPGKLLPGTPMPQFFHGGRSPYADVLDGSAGAQIELLVEHLMNLGLQPIDALSGPQGASDAAGGRAP